MAVIMPLERQLGSWRGKEGRDRNDFSLDIFLYHLNLVSSACMYYLVEIN